MTDHSLSQAGCFNTPVDTYPDITVETTPDYLSSDHPVSSSCHTNTEQVPTHGDLDNHEQLDVTASSDSECSDSYRQAHAGAPVNQYEEFREEFTADHPSCALSSASRGDNNQDGVVYNQPSYAYLYHASDALSKTYYNMAELHNSSQ